MLRYAVITPARNEAGNLPRLAEALIAQTHRPETWIVVDDGSDDESVAIVEGYAAEHPWIRSLDHSAKATGTGINEGKSEGRDLHAFRFGVAALEAPVDVFIKVDADISFEPDYLEQLIARFEAEPRLGIASGTCFEEEDGEWVRRTKMANTVWGASRAYRWEALEVVNGLEPRMGWDGIDELQMQLRGFITETFTDLPFRHNRPEGGREMTSMHHWGRLGRACWYMGYRPSYLVLRTAYQLRKDPRAVMMLGAYAKAAAKREPRCTDTGVVNALRDSQRFRVAVRRGAPAS